MIQADSLYWAVSSELLHLLIWRSVPIQNLLKTKRNSHPQMFFKTRALKSFAVFTGKDLCWSLFLIKLQVFKHRCFPVNISKCLWTALFIEHLWRLLLNFHLLNCMCSYRGVRMIEWMESKTVWKKIKSE